MTRRLVHSTGQDPETPARRGSDRFHVAITMDGNGRWALRRGRSRQAGHLAGAATVRRIVKAAPGFGITTLTLYAFSSDNWRRPRPEIDNLMHLLQTYLDGEREQLVAYDVRLSVIGRRDRIPDALRRSIGAAEALTQDGRALHLRLAVDYSARGALVEAAGRVPDGSPPSREAFERALFAAMYAPPGTRDVDLLIRTGGERRLSDFLLWESAYAELYFTDVLWPDFTEHDLGAAVQDFAARQRRFGAIASAAR